MSAGQRTKQDQKIPIYLKSSSNFVFFCFVLFEMLIDSLFEVTQHSLTATLHGLRGWDRPRGAETAASGDSALSAVCVEVGRRDQGPSHFWACRSKIQRLISSAFERLKHGMTLDVTTARYLLRSLKTKLEIKRREAHIAQNDKTHEK